MMRYRHTRGYRYRITNPPQAILHARLDNILRIDTLCHEGLTSQKVMRFSHLPLGQQNMPHMEQNKVQFGLNRQAMRVKDGMMRMIEGSVYRIVSTKNDRCSLTFTTLQCSQLLC